MTATTAEPLTVLHLGDLAFTIHENARDKGFWEGDRDMGEMLMLAVSELVEALEEHREGRPAVWYNHGKDCSHFVGYVYGESGRCSRGCNQKPEGAAVELADCIIRCLDTIWSLGQPDVDTEVAEAREHIYSGQGKFHGPLPENFGAALKNITHALCKVEDAYDLDKPGWLAYAIVRCYELIARLDVDADAVVTEKMTYNTTRPYKHGKAY